MTTRNTPGDGDTCGERHRVAVRQLGILKPQVEKHTEILANHAEVLTKQAEALKLLLGRRGDPEDEPQPQPDYLGCRDAEEILAMLVGVGRWLEDYGVDLGYEDVPPCWPWHPRAVVYLLGTSTHHVSVLAGTNPVALTEWLTRYGDTYHEKLDKNAGTNDCTKYVHVDNDGEWSIQWELLPELAAWRATSRQGRPPGLHARLQAAP